MGARGNILCGPPEPAWTTPKRAHQSGRRVARQPGHNLFWDRKHQRLLMYSEAGTSYAPLNNSLAERRGGRVGCALPRHLERPLDGQCILVFGSRRAASFPRGDRSRCADGFPLWSELLYSDTWKISNRLVLDYGLRYEVYTPITERAKHRQKVCETSHAGRGAATREYVGEPAAWIRNNLNGFRPARGTCVPGAGKTCEIAPSEARSQPSLPTFGRTIS